MIFSVFQKNWVFGHSWSTLLWYRCYYPHRLRDALSPVCRIFWLWDGIFFLLSRINKRNWAISSSLRNDSHYTFCVLPYVLGFITVFMSKTISTIPPTQETVLARWAVMTCPWSVSLILVSSLLSPVTALGSQFHGCLNTVTEVRESCL